MTNFTSYCIWESDLITARRFNSQIYKFLIHNSLVKWVTGMCEFVYNSASNQLMHTNAEFCIIMHVQTYPCWNLHPQVQTYPKESPPKSLQNLHNYAECGCRGVWNYALIQTSAYKCCTVMENSASKSANLYRILHLHVQTNP